MRTDIVSKTFVGFPVRLWLVLLVCAVGSVVDIMGYNTEHEASVLAVVGLACFAVFKATALTTAYVLARNNLWMRIVVVFIIGGFVVLSVLNGICWLMYGFGISRKLIAIISETNGQEVMEFIPEVADKIIFMLRSAGLRIFGVVFILLWILLPRISGRILWMTSSGLSAIGLIYIIIVLVTPGFGKSGHLVYARIYQCVAATLRDRRAIAELRKKRHPLPYPESAISEKKAKKIVVVIGESANRDHLSAYGYPLPTSPTLDTITEGLVLLHDAVAPSTSTAQTIPRLLTFMTDEPESKDWYEYPTLLQLFHLLGYRTYWLSNQERTGEWSNLSGILSNDADVVKYVGKTDSEDHYLNKTDEVLIPEWKNVIETGDSLQIVFLHLMGSHFQYDRRYPASKVRFCGSDIMKRAPKRWISENKANIVANYDNSILYTDSLLGIVIDGVRNSDSPAVMVYLSDHGENVYDDRDYRGRDPKFTRVPFIVYANKAYRDSNPEMMEDILRASSTPFSTSELPQMLMHLSGSHYLLYDSLRDPLSQEFKKRTRFVDEEPFYEDK